MNLYFYFNEGLDADEVPSVSGSSKKKTTQATHKNII